ncbi:MAG: zinc ribbon domain-containing protein [Myxococcota bacterium]
MSKIKCPYCGNSNSGHIPFCSECGKVLPMGDEREVMAETIGANFGLKWVLVGAFIIFVLSTISIFTIRYMGYDMNFMRPEKRERLEDPGITGLSPDGILVPSDESITIGIRTLGQRKFLGNKASSVKICGEIVPVKQNAISKVKPERKNILGIEITKFQVPNEDSVSIVPPDCDTKGFKDVEVRFESGRSLIREDGIYYASIKNPWFLFYTEDGLPVVPKLLAHSDKMKPIMLADKYRDNIRVPLSHLVKQLRVIKKENKRMQMLSFAFWGLFIFEMLAFLIGGMVSAKLSPGITIKESLTAGVFVVIFLVLRNVFFFGAGGSYMVFQLLIMFPVYTSVAALGGYLGEKWQGVLAK